MWSELYMGDEENALMVDFMKGMSETKVKKKLYIYMRKGTTCEHV